MSEEEIKDCPEDFYKRPWVLRMCNMPEEDKEALAKIMEEIVENEI